MTQVIPKSPLSYLTVGLVTLVLTSLSVPSSPAVKEVGIEKKKEAVKQDLAKLHGRTGDNTYLTFPEWYLVFSPEEYATFVEDRDPSDFPYWGHLGQYWGAYGHMYDETKDKYPFNGEYHTMLVVIGVSTTVEYAVRSVYETLVGRVFEESRRGGMTAEDRYGAVIARDYVDFLNGAPWFDYDYPQALKGLWTDCPTVGPDMLRKWERRYALSTEYLIKAMYAQMILAGTRASFEKPRMTTSVLVKNWSKDLEKSPGIEIIERRKGGQVYALLPRYHAFMGASKKLARKGVQFLEIAENKDEIVVSVLVPATWKAVKTPACRVLFVQDVMTNPLKKRIVVAVSISHYHSFILECDKPAYSLEHVFDF